MDQNNLDKRLLTARQAARLAGDFLAQNLWNENQSKSKGQYDLSLAVDVQAGELIEKSIRENYPMDLLVSEENEQNPVTAAGQPVWIVDPLDGTVNFFHRLPWFCVSIACYDGAAGEDSLLPPWGNPLASVVLAPLLHLEFFAVRGGGAWCLDNSGRQPFRQLEIHSGPITEGILSFSRGSRFEDQLHMRNFLQRLGSRARKIRSHGAAALDLAFVAQGSLMAHVQRNLQAWDIAAGMQIVHEAGGMTVLEKGDAGWNVISCPGHLAAEILEKQETVF